MFNSNNARFHHKISKVSQRYKRRWYLYATMETLLYFTLQVQCDNVTGL